jgi:hypothetical protein
MSRIPVAFVDSTVKMAEDRFGSGNGPDKKAMVSGLLRRVLRQLEPRLKTSNPLVRILIDLAVEQAHKRLDERGELLPHTPEAPVPVDTPPVTSIYNQWESTPLPSSSQLLEHGFQGSDRAWVTADGLTYTIAPSGGIVLMNPVSRSIAVDFGPVAALRS